MLNTLTAGSAPPNHKLTLKAGFLVMLRRNVNPFSGHFNCTRYIVKAVLFNLVILQSLIGDNAGKIFALHKIPYGPGDRNFPI